MRRPEEIPLYGHFEDPEMEVPQIPLREALLPHVFPMLVWEVLVRWVCSRGWFLSLLSMPALLVAFGAAAVLLYWTQFPASWDRLTYERKLRSALSQERWEEAAVYNRALLARYPDDSMLRFRRTQILSAQGRPALARAILRELAPVDGPGLKAARLRLAEEALERSDRLAARKQLERAVQEAPRDAVLRRELAKLTLEMGDIDTALEHFEQAATQLPDLRLGIAQLYRRLERDEDARRHLTAAEVLYQRRWEASGDLQDALRIAHARVGLGQHAMAERILLDAADRHGLDAVREVLADLYALQAAKHGRENDWQKQWEVLAKGLDILPRHVPTLVQVAQISLATGTEAERARKEIRKLLAEGKAPASVHLMIGTYAAQKGHSDLARLHLEQAKAQNEQMPIVLNNLAWVLAHEDAPRLDEALRIIDEALQLAPTNPAILDTRATILLAQNRPAEAITDLEKAIGGAPNQSGYLRRLAQAYEAAGDPDAAQIMRDRADRLSEQ